MIQGQSKFERTFIERHPSVHAEEFKPVFEGYKNIQEISDSKKSN